MQPIRRAIIATFAAACVALGAGACAGGAGQSTTDVSTSPAPQQITTSSGQSIRFNTTATVVAVSEAVGVGADSAFNLLLKVYAELQIPTTSVDGRQRRLGNPSMKIRRRLGGVTLVKYLECGNKDGVPNAETYDIVLNIASSVTVVAEGRATVSTRVGGVASHPIFGASNQMICSTTGELEKRIAGAVKAMAGIK